MMLTSSSCSSHLKNMSKCVVVLPQHNTRSWNINLNIEHNEFVHFCVWNVTHCSFSFNALDLHCFQSYHSPLADDDHPPRQTNRI